MLSIEFAFKGFVGSVEPLLYLLPVCDSQQPALAYMPQQSSYKEPLAAASRSRVSTTSEVIAGCHHWLSIGRLLAWRGTPGAGADTPKEGLRSQ